MSIRSYESGHCLQPNIEERKTVAKKGFAILEDVIMSDQILSIKAHIPM